MCLQALDLIQRKAGYTSLEHSVPVLCFGEGKDMELSLCAESNSLPLATQVFENVCAVPNPTGGSVHSRIPNYSHLDQFHSLRVLLAHNASIPYQGHIMGAVTTNPTHWGCSMYNALTTVI